MNSISGQQNHFLPFNTPTGTGIISEPLAKQESNSPSNYIPAKQVQEALQQKVLTAIRQFNTMEQKDIAALIRELLSFPKDLTALLKLLETNPLKEAGNPDRLILDTTILKTLFEAQGKDLFNKLMKLIQSYNIPEYAEQFRDVIQWALKYSEAEKWTAQDVATNIILLYIPWAPVEKQNFTLQLFQKVEDEDTPPEAEQKNDNVLILYLETQNLGKIKITLMEEELSSLTYYLDVEKDFTHLLKNLYRLINNHIQEAKTSSSKFYKADSPQIPKNLSTHVTGKISYTLIQSSIIISQAIIMADQHPQSLKKKNY